jgi:hypothetical protein
VAVCLQERLLGEILGVVVVADAVVAVGVDVAEMRAIQIGEKRVELRLALGDFCLNRIESVPRRCLSVEGTRPLG